MNKKEIKQILIERETIKNQKVYRWYVFKDDVELVSFFINIDTPIKPFCSDDYESIWYYKDIIKSSFFDKDEWLKIKTDEPILTNEVIKREYIKSYLELYKIKPPQNILDVLENIIFLENPINKTETRVSTFYSDKIKKVFRDDKLISILGV